MKWNARSRCFVDCFVLLLLFVRVVEQRLFHRPAAAASLVDGDSGRRASGSDVAPPPPPISWETEEGDDDDDEDGVVSDRHEHRLRFKDELVRSIKQNILKSLGRTGGTTAASGGGGGGRRGQATPPGGVGGGGGHATADPGAEEEEVSVVQVKKIIAFSDIPVLTASENGTMEFLLRRRSSPFRIDSVDLHLRISARGGGGGGGGGGHRLRHHHRGRAPSISVVHLTRPGDPFHAGAGQTGGGEGGGDDDDDEGPLPIARSTVRTKAAAATASSAGWQKVPLPSSVVQEVLDSSDPVLRLSYVCDQCEVLPSSSSGTSQPGTHRKREEEGSSNARKRHGHGLPYLTISTFDLTERK